MLDVDQIFAQASPVTLLHNAGRVCWTERVSFNFCFDGNSGLAGLAVKRPAAVH